MEKIASFSINHDILTPGVYVSRQDGDVVTYDLRFKRPNKGDYLSNGALHTIEHIFATYVRNGSRSDEVVYFGPMGCRTGFYLLLRDTVTQDDALALVKDALKFTADFEGEIPGATHGECGNYLEHDLPSAKAEAKKMLEELENFTVRDMRYKE